VSTLVVLPTVNPLFFSIYSRHLLTPLLPSSDLRILPLYVSCLTTRPVSIETPLSRGFTGTAGSRLT